MRPTLQLEFLFAKNNEQLASLAKKEPYIIALDPKGQSLTSEEFSQFLMTHLRISGSRLSFIIGDESGLPKTLDLPKALISLSPLTFTHHIARLILIEQIYRALEISKGSPYHR